MARSPSAVPAQTRSVTRRQEGQWIAFAGGAYVVAWLIGLLIGMTTPAPAATASPAALGAYFHSYRELAMIQAYCLDGIAGVALIVFAAGLRSAWSWIEGESSLLSTIVFGAGIAAGTVSLLQGLFTQVLADHVAALGNVAAIRALYDLNTEGDTYKLLALGVFLVAASLLILRTRIVPVWIGWVGLALGPLLAVAGWNFVISPAVQYVAYAVLLLVLLVWVASVSVVSVQRAA